MAGAQNSHPSRCRLVAIWMAHDRAPRAPPMSPELYLSYVLASVLIVIVPGRP